MGRKNLVPNQEKLPVWDLTVLYKGVDDPKIESDMKKNLADAKRFSSKYKTRVHKLNAKQLEAAYKEIEAISQQSSKLYAFAELTFSVDSQTPQNSVLVGRMVDHASAVSGELLFFGLEIMELPKQKLDALIKDKTLANYQHDLRKAAIWKPHHLSENEERIFTDKSGTSWGAFNKLFDLHFANRKFEFKLRNSTKYLTETEILNLSMDPDREKRKASVEGISKTLGEDSKMLTLIFNTIVKDCAIYNRWHKHKTPEDIRHMSNEVDQKTVDAMAETVQANYGIVSEFYELKRRIMGLPKLYLHDRYAPIAKSDITFSFDEAKRIILTAFEQFNREFADVGRKFFDERWIHAPVQMGKRGGAYCSYVTPDTHPVVFVNYMGKARDVQTLAHELGHGINGYMMRHQTPTNYDTPLILAETASVFGEMLVFDDLKSKVKNQQEMLSLYIDKIQDIFATVFRQTSMYKFEQDMHNLQAKKGELTTEEINTLWIKRQHEMFGDSVDVSGSELWWSYIPHFLHSPFYVYAYSFGELLVLSLYAQYKQDPEGFVPKYLEMMKTGNSKTPQEILKPFGINLSDRKFWQGGVNIIKGLVDEAKLIYKQTKQTKETPLRTT